MYSVLVTARAIRDLDEARSYIEQFAPLTAEKWYEGFLIALLRLENNPESYPLAPETAEFPFERAKCFIELRVDKRTVLYSPSSVQKFAC